MNIPLLLTGWLAVAVAVPPAPSLKLQLHAHAAESVRLCFPSGLQVHAVRRPGTGLAAVSMVLDGGRSAETPDLRGSAHLLEHIWFRSRPGGGSTIWDRASGLELDGSTHVDATQYTTLGAAADLDALLALEAGRLVDPFEGIDEATFAAERDIVRSELLWRGEHSVRTAQRLLDLGLYPEGHPYRDTTATVADVEARTLTDLRAYHASAYRPERVTLRIEADVPMDAASMKARILGAFPDALVRGEVKTCGHPVSGEEPPAPARTETATVEAPVWHREIWVAWSLPSGFWADDVVAMLAVDNLESIVWARLPYARGLRGDAQAGLGCSWSPGAWGSEVACRVELPHGVEPGKVLAAVRSSLSTQWTHSDQQMRRDLRAESVPWLLTSSLSQADALDADAVKARARWSHWGDPSIDDPVEVLATRALETSEADIAAFARKWLTPERMVSVVVEPAAPERARADRRSGKVRLEASAPGGWAVPTPRWDQVSERVLANGLRVWSAPLGNAPVARSSLTFHGGSAHVASGVQEVFEHLAVYPMPVSLKELRRKTGSFTSTTFGTGAIHSTATGSVGNLDAQIWALRAKLDAARMDFSGRQQVLDRRTDGASEHIIDWPWTTSWAIRMAHLLPGAPAAEPWWEAVRAARYVRQDEVLRWKRVTLQPANATAVVVGPFTAADAPVDKYLGKWKGLRKPPAPPSAPELPPVPERAVLLLRQEAALTDVILTCRVPGRSREHDAALDVAEGIVRRGLWQTLREEGRAYSARASVQSVHDGLGLLQLRVEVPPDEAGVALAAMFGIVGEVAGGVSDAVLSWEKQAALGRFARRTASAGALSSALRQAAAHDLRLDDLRAYPERVAAVDAEAVARLLDDCAGHEAVTVIGPDGDALSAAGIAHTVVDWRRQGREIVESLR